jgi:hypothetical protein
MPDWTREDTTFWIAVAAFLLGVWNAMAAWWRDHRKGRLKITAGFEAGDPFRGRAHRVHITVTNVGWDDIVLNGWAFRRRSDAKIFEDSGVGEEPPRLERFGQWRDTCVMREIEFLAEPADIIVWDSEGKVWKAKRKVSDEVANAARSWKLEIPKKPTAGADLSTKK